MYNMLISINPEYVEKIFNGSKQYEYRKIRCKQNVDKIIIYATSPVMKVVGEAKVEEILEESPDNIWEKTKKYSGIDLNFYQKYFKGRGKAIAYKLTNVKKYNNPKDLSSYGIKSAPQSYMYI